MAFVVFVCGLPLTDRDFAGNWLLGIQSATDRWRCFAGAGDTRLDHLFAGGDSDVRDGENARALAGHSS